MELKALIVRYQLSFADVNQALAIIDREMEEKREEARSKGKK